MEEHLRNDLFCVERTVPLQHYCHCVTMLFAFMMCCEDGCVYVLIRMHIVHLPSVSVNSHQDTSALKVCLFIGRHSIENSWQYCSEL